MRLTFHLVIEPDDQPPVITQLPHVERSTLEPGSFRMRMIGLKSERAYSTMNYAADLNNGIHRWLQTNRPR